MNNGQAHRRRAILAAARGMVDAGPISMRRLADLAGVSPATPYNLFGGKAQILREIQAELTEELQVEIDARADRGDALERVLFAIDRLGASLEAQPALHRAIFSTLYAGSGEQRAPVEVVQFWDRLFGDLFKDDIVSRATDVRAFTRNFIYLLSGALIEWVDGRLDADSLAAAVRYGFVMSAAALSGEAGRARLSALVALANSGRSGGGSASMMARAAA